MGEGVDAIDRDRFGDTLTGELFFGKVDDFLRVKIIWCFRVCGLFKEDEVGVRK